MIRISNTSGPVSSLLKYLQVVILTILLLYFGKALLVPFFYGLLVAIVMYPVCAWLEARHLARSIAILICLSIVTVLIVALMLLLGWQLSLFRQDMPELMLKLGPVITGIRHWFLARMSITLDMQDAWLRQTAMSMSGNAGHLLGATLTATVGALFSCLLIPIHAALLLYHRGTFVRFLHKTIGIRYKLKIDIVLREAIHTYFNYIKGMVLVYVIVGILNSIGLLALGVRHAVLFGMLTAIMTIIPYVGIIVSASLPVAVAFITTDSIWYPIGVVLVFSIVQYLEANVIFPKVVGTQLNVSTWAMLMAVLAGGIIWGVSGMVLFIPFVAILKIISDHTPALEAWNILLNRNSSAK